MFYVNSAFVFELTPTEPVPCNIDEEGTTLEAIGGTIGAIGIFRTNFPGVKFNHQKYVTIDGQTYLARPHTGIIELTIGETTREYTVVASKNNVDCSAMAVCRDEVVQIDAVDRPAYIRAGDNTFRATRMHTSGRFTKLIFIGLGFTGVAAVINIAFAIRNIVRSFA